MERKEAEAIYHGDDIQEAERRARRIQGQLSYGYPPDMGPDPRDRLPLGYWSEPQGSRYRAGDRILRKF